MTSCFRTISVTLIALVSLAACGHLPALPDKPSSYRLGAGDELAIKALGADELTGQYLVQDDGTIKMLLIGEVPAAGLTLDQLENAIDKKLVAGHYLKQPRVTAVLLESRPYFILGQVAGQGAFPTSVV
jgi:protein involved in polysaccharide export with SLBB domain